MKGPLKRVSMTLTWLTTTFSKLFFSPKTKAQREALHHSFTQPAAPTGGTWTNSLRNFMTDAELESSSKYPFLPRRLSSPTASLTTSNHGGTRCSSGKIRALDTAASGLACRPQPPSSIPKSRERPQCVASASAPPPLTPPAPEQTPKLPSFSLKPSPTTNSASISQRQVTAA